MLHAYTLSIVVHVMSLFFSSFLPSKGNFCVSIALNRKPINFYSIQMRNDFHINHNRICGLAAFDCKSIAMIDLLERKRYDDDDDGI